METEKKTGGFLAWFAALLDWLVAPADNAADEARYRESLNDMLSRGGMR
jgi:hypothetical protein